MWRGRLWPADSIPAHVYTRVVADEALSMSDQVLHVVRRKLREKNGNN